MKIKNLRKRIDRHRTGTSSVILRIPEALADELQRIAPQLGFAGHESLIYAYIQQGLRKDLERINKNTVEELMANLERRGISKTVLEEALSEVLHADD